MAICYIHRVFHQNEKNHFFLTFLNNFWTFFFVNQWSGWTKDWRDAPPSMMKSCPVTYPDSPAHRKWATRPISSGSPMRETGMPLESMPLMSERLEQKRNWTKMNVYLWQSGVDCRSKPWSKNWKFCVAVLCYITWGNVDRKFKSIQKVLQGFLCITCSKNVVSFF